MENSAEFTYLLITTLFGLGGGVIAYLAKQNKELATRIDDTNKATIETLKATAKQGEKVPDLMDQLSQQANLLREQQESNAQLRQRIADLEQRSR